jgi:predicted oxidoreductase (fatty acid repression mutant protein)
VTVVITISSAVGAIIWFADSLEVLKLQDFTLFGAAFPVLFKLGVSTITTQQGVRLGEQEKVSVLAAYFGKVP